MRESFSPRALQTFHFESQSSTRKIKSLKQEGGGLFGSNSYPNSASDVIAVSQNAPRTNITITERKAAPVTYNNLQDGNNTRPEDSTALKQTFSL